MHYFILTLISSWVLAAPACLTAKGSEKQLEEAMKDLSDEEVFVRLIYAETLASACPSAGVAEAIAWVIRNRVRAKGEQYGIGRGVVFKENQFRSSTGTCDVARTSIFLCPTSLETHGGWKEWWNVASEAYRKTQFPRKNPMPAAVQYFLFKHFDQSANCAQWKGQLPSWTKASRRVHPKMLELNEQCIGFYR